MPIDPSNPPTQITNAGGAIPAQLVQNGEFINAANPLVVQIGSGGGGGSNTTISNLYIVITQFVDPDGTCYVNDVLQNTEVISPIGVIVSSIWINLTRSFTLAVNPPTADIALQASNPMTNAQFQANFPLPNALQLAGSPVAAGNPLPVSVVNGGAQIQFVVLQYTATAGGAGYVTGDYLEQIIEFNVVTSPATYVSTIWRNATQNTAIGAPTAGTYVATSSTATTVAVSNLPATLGQKTTAGSLSVTLASDEVNVPVSVQTALPAGTNNIGLVTPVQATAANLNATVVTTGGLEIATAAQLPTTIGQGLKANALSVAIASDDVVATSSTQLPPALGLQSQANSLSVVVTNPSLSTVSVSTQYVALVTFTVGSATITAGDYLIELQLFNAAGSLTSTTWTDSTTGVTLSAAPPSANIQLISSGSATAALQTAGNASLVTIATETTAIAGQLPATLGNKLSAASLSTTIASNDLVSTGITAINSKLTDDGLGNLKVNVAAGSISAENPSVSLTGQTVPTYATYLGANNGGNVTGLTASANGLKVDGSAVTQPISSTQLPSVLGQTTKALSTSVAIASDNIVATSSTQLPVALGSTTKSGSVSVTLASDQGSIPVTIGANPTTFISGQQTLTTSAVALPSNALVNGIVITASATNTGIVYVGMAGVTTSTGYPLIAGQSTSIAIQNTNVVYIIGQNTTDTISLIGN